MDIIQTEHELEMCNEENEKLKQQNQRLSEALEEIASGEYYDYPERIAQQALDEVDNDV